MATYYIQRDIDNIADFWACTISTKMETLDGRLSMGQSCKDLINHILLLEMGIEMLGLYTPITSLDDQTNNRITEAQLEDFIEFVNDELNICAPLKGGRYTRTAIDVANLNILLLETSKAYLLEGGGFILLEDYT